MTAVELQGAYNVRDIGGLRTDGGARTRPGLLYRGDSLDAISAADEKILFGELGIGTVIDVRTPAEVSPALWRESGVGYRQIPLIAPEFLGKQPMAQARPAELAACYLGDLQRGAAALRQILTVLAAELDRGVPCLVHCAAGRDRTGSIMAVLLAAVGVTDADIAADYLRSNQRAGHVTRRLAANPMYANGLAAAGGPVLASAETIAVLLALIRQDSGSATGFLARCGLDPAVLAALAAALLGDRAAEEIGRAHV